MTLENTTPKEAGGGKQIQKWTYSLSLLKPRSNSAFPDRAPTQHKHQYGILLKKVVWVQ